MKKKISPILFVGALAILTIFAIAHNSNATGTFANRYDTAHGNPSGTTSCAFCHGTVGPPQVNSTGQTLLDHNFDYCSIGPATGTCAPAPAQYTLTVNIVGSGSVTKSPNKATYDQGELVSLTANPGSGYSFSGWSGNASGTANPVSVTMDGNKTVTATFTQNQPPSPTDPDMSIWIGKWIKMSIQNRGYYHEDEHRLSNDRQSFPAYLKITAWDPDNKILHATLSGRGEDDENDGDKNEGKSDEGRRWSTPISLHYISGTNLNFLCWSQITLGGNSYGFTARIKGIMRDGALVSGILTTVGGYHVESKEESDASASSEQSGGWLRITGRMIAEEKVPSDLID